MSFLVMATFLLLLGISISTIEGTSLHSPFDSGETSYPSFSSFLFPRASVPRRTTSFAFPRSRFARRLSIENRSKSNAANEILQVNKTCPTGFDLIREENGLSFHCECKKYHLKWHEDGLCYREYEQGPCPPGHRLELDDKTNQPKCVCPFFSAKYTDGNCYQEYTRGPCPFGRLIVLDKELGEGKCVCNPEQRMYYHPDSKQCFELYKQGPCPDGHILSFNYGTLRPECKCKTGYHFYSGDGKCYLLNTKGPCEEKIEDCTGTPCFMKSLQELQVQCTCLPKRSMTDGGRCYEPYTRGPCRFGEYLVFKKGGRATCETKRYCKRFDNWHWWEPHQRCYRQFTQGPCKKGKLFYLDTNGSGCSCKRSWKAYYHEETAACYEQESKGPCPKGQYFAFNTTSGSTECNCFKNFAFNPKDGTCVEKYTRGPCPDGRLVVAKQPGNTISCDCGPHMKDHYWLSDGKCYQHYEQGPCKSDEQFRKHPAKQHGAICILWGQNYLSYG